MNVRELAERRGDPGVVARYAVDRMSDAERYSTLVDLIASEIEHARRDSTRVIEMSAVRERTVYEIERDERKRHLRRDARKRRVHEAAIREEKLTTDPTWSPMKDVLQAFEDFRNEVRLELTTELLGSSFALGDGTSVTWGNATITDHSKRMNMLNEHALGTLETAVLHEKAIEMIQSANVSCLGQIEAAA